MNLASPRFGAALALARYVLALAAVGAALILTMPLQRVGIRGVLFVPAIMLATVFGGFGPGLLAAALSVAAIDYFLLVPRVTVGALSVTDAVYMAVYSLTAVIVALLMRRQRRDQEALRQQANLLDLSHDAVFVRDANDIITYWNRGAEERYGWTREEAVGTGSHQRLKTVFPAPLPQIEAELQRTGRWEGELIHTKKDGTIVIVASRWSLQRDETGKSVGVLETNNDITRQVRASEALAESQAELARVSRLTMLGEITASMAHEINQPLAAVVMNGNACRRWLDANPPNIQEALEATRGVVTAGERAGQVIARVRSIVRKGVPERAPLNVSEVITETLAFTRVELEQRRVAVRADLPDDLPRVMGDKVQLQQVLVNLILNGVEAMDDIAEQSRSLTIQARRREDDTVAVAVTDNGKGIDQQEAERIFDAFFSTKASGLGMGLSVSRSIIEQHGGKIWATPNDVSGLTMQFSLPTGTH